MTKENNSAWTSADMPAQRGRLAIVTGTGGLGYEAALALAIAVAEVILAGRNAVKGSISVGKIKAQHATAHVTFEKLDLASLASIAEFARRLIARNTAVDLQWEKRYRAFQAYGQSRLAMLMFAFELQRRSDVHGWGLMSNAAHPGYARTDLIPNGPGTKGLLYQLNLLCQSYVSHSAADGTLPLLFAATSPEAQNSGYYGPNWFYELKGPPAPVFVASQAKDAAAAKRLWDLSEQLTGARWAA